MRGALSLTHNVASSAQIHGHLDQCDAHFSPPLSDRVNLLEYAEKLALHSERFEAWADSALVGLVAIYVNDQKKHLAHVSNVSVAPEWQGRQIAQNLMSSAIDHARSLHFSLIWLTVDERSENAVHLYTKIGFKVFERNSSLLSMQKVLTNNEQ